VIFLIAGIALGCLSLLFAHTTTMILLMCASAVVILIKAIMEWFRPSNEWKGMAFGALVLMFVYGFFMPAWSKGNPNGPGADPVFGVLLMVALLANPLVAFIKLGQFYLGRPKV
jgi:hypothetical protein